MRENRPINGLGDKIRRTDFISTINRGYIIQTRHHEDWHRIATRKGAKHAAGLKTIHMRHIHVQQDDIVPPFAKCIQRLAAILSFVDVKSRLL